MQKLQGDSSLAASKAPPERSSAAPLLARADVFATQLAQWFTRHRRILPWREAPSAYKTVVSELMLQQTQVVTALPYFERWIERWPDFAALAAADEAQVLQMWEGLGYYSRARNLLKLARAWVAAAGKPATAAEWLAYPGVGPYTAAAIASIAFGEHAAVVDGNVVRILARLSADQTAWPSAAHAVKALTPLAQGIIARAENPGLHNEAMMELGATLCRKGQPQCLLCPVATLCAGKSLGEAVDALPRIARKKTQERLVNRALVVDHARNAVLLYRYGAGSRRLAGLCEVPLWQDVAGYAKPAKAHTLLASQKPLLVRRRGIGNERIEERFYAWDATIADPVSAGGSNATAGNRATGDGMVPEKGGTAIAAGGGNGTAGGIALAEDAAMAGGLFWQPLDALAEVTLTGPHRRWLTQLLGA